MHFIQSEHKYVLCLQDAFSQQSAVKELRNKNRSQISFDSKFYLVLLKGFVALCMEYLKSVS